MRSPLRMKLEGTREGGEDDGVEVAGVSRVIAQGGKEVEASRTPLPRIRASKKEITPPPFETRTIVENSLYKRVSS